MINLDKYLKSPKERFRLWLQEKYFQLAVLNVFLILLVLLRSAGYFEPFFPITINVIVILGILAATILLGVDSSFSLATSLIFWLLTALFRILDIIPWAERTALYSFEALAIGAAHLMLETIFKKRK